MRSTVLVTGRGRNLPKRLSEAELADGDLRRDGKTPGFQIDKQLWPTLTTFAHADLKPVWFLLAFRLVLMTINMQALLSSIRAWR